MINIELDRQLKKHNTMRTRGRDHSKISTHGNASTAGLTAQAELHEALGRKHNMRTRAETTMCVNRQNKSKALEGALLGYVRK